MLKHEGLKIKKTKYTNKIDREACKFLGLSLCCYELFYHDKQIKTNMIPDLSPIRFPDSLLVWCQKLVLSHYCKVIKPIILGSAGFLNNNTWKIPVSANTITFVVYYSNL